MIIVTVLLFKVSKRDAKKAIEEKVGICKKQKVVKPQKEPKPTTIRGEPIRGERIEGADIDDIAPTTSEESVFSQDVRSSSEISSLEAAMLAEYVDNDSEEEMLKSFSSKRVSKDSTKSKESSDDDESLDDDEDTPVPVKTASAKPAANVEESSESEEEESEKEEGSNEEDEPKTVKKKKVTDVEMVDAPSAAAKKAPQTPATGSKTLFMGNLSFSIEENDVINFFKDAGEVVQVRFAMRDNCFAGYGHVEFATPDAAQKALKLNGEDLVGRAVKLDFAKERGGAYTPGGFSGGRGGGRFGGRDGGGGRGRGRGPSRPSIATLGTGKKTTFGDD
ncbi:uncharacterized protein [Rutidosis leptorrhynchoides]|uniref:uncharacterized protein n=1 Tax=Rutidosis leptorrhynchoides TaxID=125765 RepID=UPI003A99A3BA